MILLILEGQGRREGEAGGRKEGRDLLVTSYTGDQTKILDMCPDQEKNLVLFDAQDNAQPNATLARATSIFKEGH